MNEQEFQILWQQSRNTALQNAKADARDELIAIFEECYGLILMSIGSGEQSAQTNKELYRYLGPMLLGAVDFSYSAFIAYKFQCALPLSLIHRTALETYLNFRYITESNDYSALAKQYFDFTAAEIKRLKDKGGSDAMVDATDPEIIDRAKFWMNKNGVVSGGVHWLGRGKNYAEIAKALKSAGKKKGDDQLVRHVLNVYWLTSNITHGSPIIQHSFKRQNNEIFPIASEKNVRFMAVGVTRCALGIAAAASEFFTINFPTDTSDRILNALDSSFDTEAAKPE